MSGSRERDEHSGVETTGHEWDGIKELDNPLPRWWLWIFYATIAFSVGYWVLMPAWPGIHGYTHGMLGNSARATVAQDLKDLATQRGAAGAALKTASLQQIEADPKLQSYALSVGQSVFADNCAPCHGQSGTGAKGYPNLRDDVWLWGGKLEDIQHTITVGVRSGDPDQRFSQMPAFGRDGMLQPAQVNDLTEYVTALSHRTADAAAVARAAPVFAQQCAACHGADGKGNQAFGAPNLTDADWLYGADRVSIHDQIWNGHGGVMPAWGHRFDPATIKALAVYIHVKSGGGQ
ncbi:cytochrome-c oxidase, cbb3-type subunit III [Phenylobacterium montanum]|uniref:Cbb3-type cytochrome c oxidase subunit n=1 Tax=Phenylobacterium montanum TaxID=2823693 RepID=A0A975FYX4_9CAUL|nr:cytochrome-c oxidase, cbb3-type subunit III [Caulobacter sp. S6]QUD87534.1 cytochrome-c oxidase, cbb3-type subunit III [Caulobacter sp. S6]